MFFKIVFFSLFYPSISICLCNKKPHAFTLTKKPTTQWPLPLGFLNFPANFQKKTQRVNLELLVADYDRIGSSDPIGKVLLGYNRKGLELKHWKEMIENPRRPIVHWHVLKVNKLYFLNFWSSKNFEGQF